MRRLAGVAALLAAAALLATPAAAASSPSCEDELVRLAAVHPRVWREAGSPSVDCAAFIPGPSTAFLDTRANTIRLEPGYDGTYGRQGAHELGHAWQYRRLITRPKLAVRYARIRGFTNPYSLEAREDYAEAFAYALGEWVTQVTFTAPPPYDFQTAAGPVTDDQLRRLRREGLLPEATTG